MNNFVYYWKNRLQSEKEFDLKPYSYIVHFSIVNQNLSEVFNDWLSFPGEKELLSFIKYVVLPSGYYSRLFGEKEGCVIIEADSYDDVVELLSNNTYKVDKKLIRMYKEDYQLIADIINTKFSMENINEFCNSYNSHLDYKNIVFSTIEVYENIKEVGLQTIKEYEEEGMLDILEGEMKMTKKEIIEMFLTIDENPFMMKRIKEFLNNTMGL